MFSPRIPAQLPSGFRRGAVTNFRSGQKPSKFSWKFRLRPRVPCRCTTYIYIYMHLFMYVCFFVLILYGTPPPKIDHFLCFISGDTSQNLQGLGLLASQLHLASAFWLHRMNMLKKPEEIKTSQENQNNQGPGRECPGQNLGK